MNANRTQRGLTIQEMAAQTGVTAHTLRYYERIGLLRRVARSGSGHRRYNADDIGWVQLLVCLRQTGMSIQAMLRFVAADGGDLSTAQRRLALLEAHRDAVRAHQLEVAQSLAVIEGKLEYYRATVLNADGQGDNG